MASPWWSRVVAPVGAWDTGHGVLPAKLTYGQIRGFTLYATRTLLSGEGAELLELAKSNLRDLEVG